MIEPLLTTFIQPGANMEEAKIISNQLVPQYIKDLKVYKAGKPIEELAREKGLERIVKLASNENPLGAPPKVVETIKKALEKLQFYPDMNSYDLKEKLAKKFNLSHDNIILGNGSEGIISYIMRSFVGPGSKIITSQSTFIGFEILSRSVGAELIQTPLTEEMKFDVNAIVKAVDDNTRVIYIANPNNPTGTYITTSEFEYLIENVPSTTLIILDEAYFEFAKDEPDYPDTMKYRKDNILTLRTFSKSYGMAGLRLGYGFGHHDLISNLHKVKLPFEPSLLAQAAGVVALDCDDHLSKTLENNSRNYSKMFAFLEENNYQPIPSKTNFITFKAEGFSEKLNHFLLDNGVIIRDLKQNGLPDYLRVSIGRDEECDFFIEKMKNF